MESLPDSEIRAAAFSEVRRLLSVRGDLTGTELRAGFKFQGTRTPLINPQRGIFKPRQMTHLLSIRTVYPRPGARVWYDDQRDVHAQIYDGEDVIDYAFMGTNPNTADNRWLREAMEARVPIMYFLGVSPGVYQPILPTYVVGWDARQLKAQITFGLQELRALEFPATTVERRYALREVKQRLHQASFREAVITAYGGRCAVTGLPEQRLLDAAHIVADSNEELGHPIVRNGLPLSKIHHAAFDAHLIGIDSDYRIHVSRRLLDLKDGPMLELLKQSHRLSLHLPNREKDHPDRDRLALRFDEFRGHE
jgi:putative restriction endonuclease